jgi:hypothetical protein
MPRPPKTPKVLRTPSPATKKRKFDAFALNLGTLVYSWNRLHEMLCLLFCAIAGYESEVTVPLAMWHSIRDDRTQRDLLLDTAKAAMPNKYPPPMLKDIEWLIERTNALSDTRNNAIHSPFRFVTDDLGSEVKSSQLFGNPRASKLKDKDLLAEFSWHGAAADTLGSFAEKVYRSLRDRKRPWPERPQLPKRDQFQRRKQKRRDGGS